MRSDLRARLFGAASTPVAVGRFVLGRKLGEGATSVVFSAFDPQLQRDVALKLVHGNGSSVDGIPDEARALAKLRHPNVLGVFEVGAHGASAFLVTELVTGGTLRELLAEDRPPDERLEQVLGVADGVSAAHRAGIVHGDLKPENVLIDAGRPRVADFGFARAFLGSEFGAAPSSGRGGTPAYLAPERRAGRGASPASDQFELGLLALEVCFGMRPLVTQSGEPDAWDSPRGHPLSFALPVIRRACASDEEARFASVADFAASLRAARDAALVRATRVRRASLATLLAVAVCGLVAVGWRSTRSRPSTDAPSDGALFQEVMPMIAAGRYADCADHLEPRVRSAAVAVSFVQCAEQTHDPARLDRACARFRELSPDPVPSPCDAIARAADAAERAGRPAECAERILAAPPTVTRTVVLTRCVAAAQSRELYRRQCIYLTTLNGLADPTTRCAAVSEMQLPSEASVGPDGGPRLGEPL